MLYVLFLKDLFGPGGFLNAADAFELGYYGLFDPMLGTFPKRAFIFLSSIYVTSKDTFFKLQEPFVSLFHLSASSPPKG